MYQLEVEIDITPHEPKIQAQEMDALFAGEISRFEEYFVKLQSSKGIATPSRLISAEHAILRSYMMYLYTTKRGTP